MAEAGIEIREAKSGDATALLEYMELVNRESDFLSFGPGELVLNEEQEVAFLEACHESFNKV